METKWKLEKPKNAMDAIPTYAPGTPQREQLLRELKRLKSQTEEVPLIINGKPVRTKEIKAIPCPHDHKHALGKVHYAGAAELKKAINAALDAHHDWAALDGYQRAAVFLRAADLLAGPRRIEHVAAIMANHSKTPFEAEIDLIELIDFWRLNAYYVQFIYEQQPDQFPGELNRFDWRSLEGFVLAIPPFNFYAIGGNLPTSPAIAGNVALWKPATSVAFSNYKIMQALMDAGLPEGVINFVPYDARKHGDIVLEHPALAGLHFTGSYQTFTYLWQKIGQNLQKYRNFPRIVGETGGKDFIFVHPSADAQAVVANTVRGAFEYQGQKCSAASRIYVPQSLWKPIKDGLIKALAKFKCGPVDDLSVAMGAIINESAYQTIVQYLKHAKQSKDYTILCGGGYEDAKGWFVEPTLIQTHKPDSKLICEEIFGPVLTAYVYPDNAYEETLKLCDRTSPYALTGAIFAQDRYAITKAEDILRFASGNFYINDKPTGAIVGRQPFGGARQSGTNDKAGFWLNVLRWMSPRAIKETLAPPTRWERPYLE